MPTCPPPIKRGDPGFTLIEMLVVLTILGIIASITALNWSRRPGLSTRVQLQSRLFAAFDKAHAQALRGGSRQEVDVAGFGDKALNLTAEPELATQKPGAISFYPDGSSSGGSVKLDGRNWIQVDWLTGRAKLVGP